ncbi:serine/threonine protein kinase [Oxalobacteraceae bacterium]|nr:serine/threonine protein kinase [Oxalobacteraceae bacterium]
MSLPSAPDTQQPLVLPSVPRAYHITALLGQGSHGVVYLVGEVDGGRQLALKIMPGADGLAPPAVAARLAALDHPHIVREIARGNHADAAWLATEYVDGESLQALLARRTPSRAESLAWMLQLLDALAALHGAGLAHGDVKPGNLLIARADGALKLNDFGLASELPPFAQVTPPRNREPLAQASPARMPPRGTPSHLAPELWRGQAPGVASDLFAAGVVLHRLLLGRAPFAGTPFEVMTQILQGAPLNGVDAAAAAASPALSALLARALASDPCRRYPGANDFRHALQLAMATQI